jgi:hypothetical protein
MKTLALLLGVMVFSVSAWAQSSSSSHPLLLRTPTVSRTQIAFRTPVTSGLCRGTAETRAG